MLYKKLLQWSKHYLVKCLCFRVSSKAVGHLSEVAGGPSPPQSSLPFQPPSFLFLPSTPLFAPFPFLTKILTLKASDTFEKCLTLQIFHGRRLLWLLNCKAIESFACEITFGVLWKQLYDTVNPRVRFPGTSRRFNFIRRANYVHRLFRCSGYNEGGFANSQPPQHRRISVYV